MSHNAEVLNLNTDMVNDLIQKVEGSIFEITKQLDKNEIELAEVNQIYLPVKNENDKLKELILKEKKTLEALIGFRDNKNERKQIRVYKSISNSSPKPKKQNFPFTQAAVDVLTKEQKILSVDNLIRKIFENNPDWKVRLVNNEKGEKSKIKYNLNAVALGKVSKIPKLKLYNEKFCLPEWLDETESNLLSAKYLNGSI